MFLTLQLEQAIKTVYHHTPLLVLACLGVLLLLWRLWRFTIVPAWWPDEPKLLPYWVPGVGRFCSDVKYLGFPLTIRLRSDIQAKPGSL